MVHTEHTSSNVEAVVFLDRDGTLTRERGIVHDPCLLEFERGAIGALRQLSALSIPVFVITNQPGIAKGTIRDYESVCARFLDMLEEENLSIAGLYTCPHVDEDGCECRKPKAGLIEQALADNHLVPERIYSVGDRLHDAVTATRLGGTGILVRTGYGESTLHEESETGALDGIIIADDVEDAVRRIVLRERAAGRAILPVPHYRWPEISADMERRVMKQLHASVSIRTDAGAIGQLERQWALKTGRAHAIGYSSGTMALFAAYVAAGVRKGDEVIAPAYGYFATASPALLCGATIRFVDTDESGNPAPEAIIGAMNKNTKAIVVSHLYGALADCSAIATLAKERGVTLIEDASHAIGAANETITAGRCGDITVCSLQANKLAPAGEGGILLTDDAELTKRASTVGHFRQYSHRFFEEGDELLPYLTTGMGLKLRMHPIAAAIGIESLAALDEVRKGRLACAKKMMGLLSQRGFKTTAPLEELSLYNLPLLLPEQFEGCTDQITALLKNNGLTCDFNHNSNTVLPNLPLFQTPNPYYPDAAEAPRTSYPVAQRFANRIFLLPLWHREYEHEIGLAYARGLSEAVNEIGCQR